MWANGLRPQSWVSTHCDSAIQFVFVPGQVTCPCLLLCSMWIIFPRQQARRESVNSGDASANSWARWEQPRRTSRSRNYSNRQEHPVWTPRGSCRGEWPFKWGWGRREGQVRPGQNGTADIYWTQAGLANEGLLSGAYLVRLLPSRGGWETGLSSSAGTNCTFFCLKLSRAAS